jgi:hypothetical protein
MEYGAIDLHTKESEIRMRACNRVGCSGGARRGVAFERPKTSVPRPERFLERVVQHGHAHREKRLNGVAVPAHLLPLDHPLRNDLIHRGFGEGGRNRLAGSIAVTVIGLRIGVRVQIGRQLTEVGAEVLEPRGIGPRIPSPDAQL